VIPPLTSHFWSLAVEEQFYLVWPLLVWWLSRKRLRAITMFLIIAPVVVRLVLTHLGNHTLGNLILLPTRVDTLAVGALIAIVSRDDGGLRRVRQYAVPVGIVCAIGFFGVCWANGSPANYGIRMQRYGFSLAAFGFASLLIWTLTASSERPLAGVFTARWLRWIGNRSYAIYVWHPIATRGFAYMRLPQRLSVLPLPARQLLLYVGVVVTAAIMAQISWVLIESPFLSLKRFVPRPKGTNARQAALVRNAEGSPYDSGDSSLLVSGEG